MSGATLNSDNSRSPAGRQPERRNRPDTEALKAVPDAIDQAIAAAPPSGATSAVITMQLANGRQAQIAVPVPLTQIDVFAITDILHQYLRDQPAPARSRLLLPR